MPTVEGIKNNSNVLNRKPAPFSIYFTGTIFKHKQVKSNRRAIILPGMTR
jgi:hypothetical protein